MPLIKTSRREGHQHVVDLDDLSLGSLADVSATSPTVNQVLAWDGTAWAPTDGGGAVDSVFGRTGVVIAQAGDYDFPKISGTIGDAQVPVSAVTQHQGLLSLTEAQITDLANYFEVPNRFSELTTQVERLDAQQNLGLHIIDGGTF